MKIATSLSDVLDRINERMTDLSLDLQMQDRATTESRGSCC